jgi:hypothetical protein
MSTTRAGQRDVASLSSRNMTRNYAFSSLILDRLAAAISACSAELPSAPEIQRPPDQPALGVSLLKGCQSATGRTAVSILMSDARDARIERCRLLVAECRAKADALEPEEKQAVLTVIESCERLIALVQDLVKK